MKVGAPLFVLFAAVAATLAIGAAAAPPTEARLVTGSATFPNRDFVLSLPSRTRLSTSSVHVTENGLPVHDLAVTPAGATERHDAAAVLAIDTSNSMRGAPIVGAYAAARAFASHRAPAQQLAMVTFNGDVHVRRPFTTDAALISKTLSHQAALGEGTRIYDALERSARLLDDSGAASRSILLLSDGADVGSVAKRDDIVRKLQQAHIRVFAVGLASRAFNESALTRLASRTGGTFTAAHSPSDLAPIFDELGFALSREYVIRYRSTATPSKHVAVEVGVPSVDVRLDSAYEAPALNLPQPGSYHRTLGERLVQSPFTAVLVALLGAVLLAAAVMVIVRPRSGNVRQRVGAFVSLSFRPVRTDVTAATASANPALLERTQRSLARLRRWDQFGRTLEIADISTSPMQIVLLSALGTTLVALLFAVLLGPIGVIFGFAVPVGTYMTIRSKLDRKRRAFAEQLPDNLEVLASALRAGHSLVAALSVVVENAPEPSRSEFSRVVADEQLGAPLEDALGVVVDRMANRDLDQVALVARLQRETGSNSAEVLDRVVENIRARLELRRLVRTLTAQGRMSRWVLTLIPVVLGLLLTLINPGYLSPLFDHGSGRVLLVLAVLMITAGSLVIRKIVNIKV